MLGTSQLAVSVVLVVLLLWRIPVAPLCRDQGEGAPSSSIGSRRIAVVAPFIAAEIDAVEANLLTWTRFSPCSDAVRNNHSTDLVFYFHRDLQHAPAIVSRLKKGMLVLCLEEIKNRTAVVIAAVPAADRCFGHVSFLSALLTPEEDRYPAGASLMFFKLFDFYRYLDTISDYFLKAISHTGCKRTTTTSTSWRRTTGRADRDGWTSCDATSRRRRGLAVGSVATALKSAANSATTSTAMRCTTLAITSSAASLPSNTSAYCCCW